MRGSPPTRSGTCLVMLVLSAGCHPAPPSPPPSVSGIVTLEGEPVAGGRLTLFGPGDAVASAEIESDGSFLVTRPPRGPVRVSIESRAPARLNLSPTEPLAPASFRNKPVARAYSPQPARRDLPARYADPERSGLEFTVESGEQVHDFHLGLQGPLAERPDRTPPLQEVGLRVGDRAPNIEGEDLDGRRFALRDYRGQVVVLTFWGHW